MIVPALICLGLRFDYRDFDQRFPDDQIFEQESIGTWLKEHSHPDETLFVWGFATGIYFHSHLKPASRFLWTDLLTGKIPGSDLSNDPQFDTSSFVRPEAWQALWEDFAKHKPTYIVDTAPANIHNYAKYSLKKYPELNSWIAENYQKIGFIEKSVIYKTVEK